MLLMQYVIFFSLLLLTLFTLTVMVTNENRNKNMKIKSMKIRFLLLLLLWISFKWYFCLLFQCHDKYAPFENKVGIYISKRCKVKFICKGKRSRPYLYVSIQIKISCYCLFGLKSKVKVTSEGQYLILNTWFKVTY